jgi:peptide deformylase
VNVLTIRRLGDPVLREPARAVETYDAALQRLSEQMLEAMYAAPGVGLAANQIGLSVRMFVYDPGDGSGHGTVCNPVLSGLDGEQEEDEGCLSIPGLYYATKRALHVRLDGTGLDGGPLSLEGEGLLARIFQHETDHLNGMLFIDRLSQTDRRAALAAFRDMELESRPPRPGAE